MSRKKQNLTEAQQIEARLATKSFAKLEEEINKVIAENKQDKPLSSLFDGSLDVTNTAWGSGGPPHMILGRIVEDENPR